MISNSIQIVPTSAIPKYLQIVQHVIEGIERKSIGFKGRLPSINEASIEYDVSRDTVEKAYKSLKSQGLIFSVPGKGYFAVEAKFAYQRRVLMVFNKLSTYKKMIFEGFVKTMGTSGQIDLQVYHENYDWFEKIIKEKAGKYTDYVIIPSFKGEEEAKARVTINKYLQNDKIWLLNNNLDHLNGVCGAVYQNYEEDLYKALSQNISRFTRYAKMQLVFPEAANYSRGIVRGFQRFYLENQIKARVIYKNFAAQDLEKDCCYLVILDHDLVTLVKKIKEKNWTPGKEIGILTYNDSPLKEVLLDGITVVSTDHYAMGEQLATMLRDNVRQSIENPSELINRNSL